LYIFLTSKISQNFDVFIANFQSILLRSIDRVVIREAMSVEDAMVRTQVELVESTPVAENLLVTSFRKSYLYGEWTKVKKVVDIHEFLLDILKFTGGLTREKLVKFTNLPRTTLYDALKRLIDEDDVITLPVLDQKRRRRPKTLFMSAF